MMLSHHIESSTKVPGPPCYLWALRRDASLLICVTLLPQAQGAFQVTVLYSLTVPSLEAFAASRPNVSRSNV